ncbi:MAG: peptidase domain-containing ABC transporter, partial [Caldilineaceae bacterium]|nr:peptidase domain-containing ABC transporter [Caldilineaceae bacterium]
MTVSKRSLFRPSALAHYSQPDSTLSNKTDTPVVSGGFWATLWLVMTLVGGVLITPLTYWRRKHVPVVLQMTTTQCGAACLTMVLNFYGRAISLATVSEQMDVGRDGATLLAIAQAARHYGLQARAYTGEPDRLADLPLPAILHWNFSHFVVLERWEATGAFIVDPASGRRPVTAAELDRSFTGVVLSLTPESTFQRQRASGSQRLWQQQLYRLLIASGAWRAGVKALLATVAVQVTAMALPLLTKVIVDQIVPQQQLTIVPIVAAGIGAVVLMQMLVGYLRRLVLIRLQADVDTGLMAGFLEHLLALPYRFYQQRTSGDLLMRLSSNTMIRELLTTQTISALMDTLLVITFLVVLLVQAPSFGLVTLSIGLVQVILLFASTSRMHDLAQRHLSTQAEAHAYLVEALAGINVVKATGAEERVLHRWTGLHHKALAVTVEKQRLAAFIDTLVNGLQMAAPLLLLLIGAQQVLAGSLTLGTMLAFNALALGFLTPLDSLVTSAQQLQSVGAHLNRLADILEAAREQNGDTAPTLSGRIALEEVSYHYDRHSAPVLQEISVQIEPGQKVAIVGRSGSGKSTLARLLLGLHEPTSGTIRFDQTPLAELDRRALRRQLGVVLQEVFLFSGSIRQNITFGLNDLSLEEMLTAAKLACIDRDIAHMPMDFETMVAEGGAGLSGGQRQRLALARALARKPAILLLDEATSHLDTHTEQQIEQNLQSLGCTQIVIAHRLSTIAHADRIVVME